MATLTPRLDRVGIWIISLENASWWWHLVKGPPLARHSGLYALIIGTDTIINTIELVVKWVAMARWFWKVCWLVTESR